MSLYTVSSGATINAADVNQLVNTLQAGSGATESAKYWTEAGTYDNTGSTLGEWIQTKSATSTPVSVSADTSITAPISCGSMSTQQLNSSGFFIGCASTGISNTARFGGVWTVQY